MASKAVVLSDGPKKIHKKGQIQWSFYGQCWIQQIPTVKRHPIMGTNDPKYGILLGFRRTPLVTHETPVILEQTIPQFGSILAPLSTPHAEIGVRLQTVTRFSECSGFHPKTYGGSQLEHAGSVFLRRHPQNLTTKTNFSFWSPQENCKYCRILWNISDINISSWM